MLPAQQARECAPRPAVQSCKQGLPLPGQQPFKYCWQLTVHMYYLKLSYWKPTSRMSATGKGIRCMRRSTSSEWLAHAGSSSWAICIARAAATLSCRRQHAKNTPDTADNMSFEQKKAAPPLYSLYRLFKPPATKCKQLRFHMHGHSNNQPQVGAAHSSSSRSTLEHSIPAAAKRIAQYGTAQACLQ